MGSGVWSRPPNVGPASFAVRNGVMLRALASLCCRSVLRSLPKAAFRQKVSMITLWSECTLLAVHVATPREAEAWKVGIMR